MHINVIVLKKNQKKKKKYIQKKKFPTHTVKNAEIYQKKIITNLLLLDLNQRQKEKPY